MMIHPVRMSGMVIGTSRTYEYFDMIQDRILTFVESHAHIAYDQLKNLMHNTKMLTKDLGTVLVGEQAVKEGLAEIFVRAGAVFSTPTCGPCLGGHMGILADLERCVSTTNRNFVGRMGHVTSEIYLASPYTAAASAVLGKLATAKEL